MMFLRRVLNKNPFPSIFPIQAFRFYKCRRYPKCTMTFTKKETLEHHEYHELCVPPSERKGYLKKEEKVDSDSTGKNHKGKGKGRRSFWSLIWNLPAVDDQKVIEDVDYPTFSSSVRGQIAFKGIKNRIEDLITQDYLARGKDNLA